MSAARQHILGGIRKALRRGPLSRDRAAALDARPGERRNAVIPARGRTAGRARLEALCDEPARVGPPAPRLSSPRALPGPPVPAQIRDRGTERAIAAGAGREEGGALAGG